MEELFYRICPRCFRGVPASSAEHYCINDGEPLLEACPNCKTRIGSPYARFCGICGLEFSSEKVLNKATGGSQ